MGKKRDDFIVMLQEQVALLQKHLRETRDQNVRLIKENRQLRDKVIGKLLRAGR